MGRKGLRERRSRVIKKLKNVQMEVDEILEKEEIKWKQWTKAHQFQNGGRNTKFFHICANQRRKKNHICKVEDEGGRLFTTLEDISRKFIDFYHQLFSTSNPRGVDACIEALETRVSLDMNEQLIKEFTTKEVSYALS